MKLWTLISSGLGAGYAPKAPGTFGSLVGLALGCALLSLGHLPLLAGIVIATALGVYAVGKLPEANADPKWVVIDEIAGQMIPLLALTGVSLRGVAVVPAMADAEADALGCPHVSATGGPSTVADPGNGLLDIYAGATPGTLANRTRALIAAVRANNSSISDADLTNTLIAAYCPVVAHEAGMSLAAKQAALKDFIAGAEPLIAAH